MDIKTRNDISSFMVHLTRKTGKSRIFNAKNNLINILKTSKIEARNHHCFFSPLLAKESPDIQDKFKVACFTEVPFENIKYLTQISNRQKNFEGYGIIFSKDGYEYYEDEEGMQQYAIHPNSVFYLYGHNKELKKAIRHQYDQWLKDIKSNNRDSEFYRFGALVNIISEEHNFQWEREYRTIGDFNFVLNHIMAIIAPEDEHDEIRAEVGQDLLNGLLFLDITWNLETIVNNMSLMYWNACKK